MEDAVTSYRLKEAERAGRREHAELIFHYPQFTLDDAAEMPVGDINLLLAYARLNRAQELLDLANVMAATQSSKSFKRLTNQLEGVIKSLTNQL
jgi:hypothetical protein